MTHAMKDLIVLPDCVADSYEREKRQEADDYFGVTIRITRYLTICAGLGLSFDYLRKAVARAEEYVFRHAPNALAHERATGKRMTKTQLAAWLIEQDAPKKPVNDWRIDCRANSRRVPCRAASLNSEHQSALIAWARLHTTRQALPGIEWLHCSLNGVALSRAQAGKPRLPGCWPACRICFAGAEGRAGRLVDRNEGRAQQADDRAGRIYCRHACSRLSGRGLLRVARGAPNHH